MGKVPAGLHWDKKGDGMLVPSLTQGVVLRPIRHTHTPRIHMFYIPLLPKYKSISWSRWYINMICVYIFILKGTVHLNIKNIYCFYIWPDICRAIYQCRLFWRGLLSFGGIGCIIELYGIWFMQKSSKLQWKDYTSGAYLLKQFRRETSAGTFVWRGKKRVQNNLDF